MSQQQAEQFKKEDMDLLESLDDLIESAELESQKTVTMLNLQTNANQAFEGSSSLMKKIQETVALIKQEDIRMIATEKVALYKLRFNEVIEQAKY